jgi:Uma2 family endonuclease
MLTTRDTRFTVDEYMALPEGFPAQLVDGGLVKEPAPTHWHQGIVVALLTRLVAVAGSQRVLVAPTDVVIDRWNVFQPDVLVFGPEVRVGPDTPRTLIPILVAEIHSPGTEERDREVKSTTYLRAGVREVWLLDPRAETIEIRTRGGEAGGTKCSPAHEVQGATHFARDEEAASQVVPGFRVSWAALLA